MSPKVSVIIVNWNGRHLLADCLSSVFRQTFKDFETILVDNGSIDGSVQWVRENYPNVHVVYLEQNLGFSGGNNVGIRLAKGKYIVLLNNDTEVEDRWLESLYDYIQTDDRIAACDSKVMYYTDRDAVWSAGAVYSVAGSASFRRDQGPDGRGLDKPTDVFVAVACSVIYRKSALDEIGCLDEDFFAGYEDVDWSFRAHLRGYRIVNVPASRVYHKVSVTHVHNSNSFVYHGQRNVFSVFIKNMPSTLLLRYWPLHLVYTVGSFVYFAKIGRGRAFLRAKWDAMKQLPSLLHKRQAIQRTRKVSSKEIDALLSRTWFKLKLTKLLESEE